MPSPIKVPALGESITEAIIANWLQPVGARVEIDQPLVELETDKVTVEVPSPVAGIIIRHAAEKGATVRVGDIIGEVDNSDAAQPAPSASSSAASQPAPSASPVPPAAVPSARAEAVRSGVDLGEVHGTGRGGRILKEDVQRAAQPVAAAPLSPPVRPPPRPRPWPRSPRPHAPPHPSVPAPTAPRRSWR